MDPKGAIAQAIALYQKGDLAKVNEICRRIVALDPEHTEAINLLGLVAYHGGHHREALELISNAIRLNGANANFHNNLGLAYIALGNTQQAISSYQQAIALNSNLAIAYMNLGIALVQQKRFDEALTHYRQALTLSPNDAEVHNNIGVTFIKQGKFTDAARHFRRATELNPQFLQAHTNLALTVSDLGDSAQALAAARRALSLNETAWTRSVFVSCVANLRSIPDSSPEFCRLLARALRESWDRPIQIEGTSVACLKLDPAIHKCMEQVTKVWPKRTTRGELFGLSRLDTVGRNTLLLAVLETTPVSNMEFECFLTAMRFALLQTAASAPGQIKEPALRLYSALAQQCFINGYIYDWTDEECQQAHALRARLVEALKSNARIASLWPIAVAAYFPLHTLDGADVLLARTWRDPVEAVLRQQVREPRQEAELRKEISRITPIDDEISMQVRGFYEENPYPCWTKAAKVRWNDPPQEQLGGQERQSILIAGCGTGRDSIETALIYPNADVLAIDLSLASLGYALRKSREAGVDNIRYAQADILELASLDRKFDRIEASGVLHHLSNPSQGWRVLLSLLRPGGLMRVGLYSELGGRHVSAGQAFFAKHGYGQAVEDIRRCRHAVWSASKDDPLLRQLMTTIDFYSLGSCRDFLFHVQEHRFTIPAIKDFLAENDLSFVGFSVPAAVLAKYRSLFPQDQAANDLDLWHAFETKNPDTFTSMYQFWVKSPAT
jgi:Flp pilus assembly protein TadD/2-polyprenyl-3-methyl-5-hydroxy-6-metoxy-1,4-benzoquinol methylase